jgi:phosphate starvation-inducible protein PhoH and related proteins
MSRRKAKVLKYDYIKIPEIIEKSWQEQRDEELQLKHTIKARTKNHEKLINSILINVITFVYGSAGTGKTFISCGMAAKLLMEGKIKKIVLTRPQIEVDNKTAGFLPGSSIEKMMPYMVPLIDALEFFLGQKQVERLIKEEIIEILPVGLIRGRSIKNSMIICDESQNMSYLALKTLLTRIDTESRVVLTGDATQSDVFNYNNAFIEVINKLNDLQDEIGFVEFRIEDCQRAGIVKKILERL